MGIVSFSFAAISAAQTPNVAAYNPYHAAVGDTINLQGSNLDSVTVVYFNGTPSPLIHANSVSSLDAVVPAGATTGKISVTNPYGSYTTSSDFVVDSANGGGGGGGGGNGGSLSISTFTPWSGLPGDTITFSGSGFANGITVAFGNKVSLDVQVLNSGTLTAKVPIGGITAPVKITLGNTSYTTGSNFVVSGSEPGGDGLPAGVFVQPPSVSIPAGAMTGHPRIFIRQSDLPTYRAWANAGNPIWTSILSLANTGKQRMDTNAIPDNGWTDSNGSSPTESYAQLFAFMALVHPTPSVREDYANRAHTLLMRVIDEAVKGQADGQPWRQKNFATNNRMSWYGEGFPLTVDWVYDTFTAADKVKIRKVFLRWIQENLRANTTAQEHPRPVAIYNDPALVDGYDKVRWATNNYYANHARTVGLLSMALDAADDVPADATDPAAGTLRRFVGNAIQAWLYQANEFENTVGKGGISPEGLGYGSLTFRAYANLLLAMQTTGTDDVAAFGPQAGQINTPYWQNEVIDGYMHMLSPSKVIQESWIGPTYLPYLFGDDDKYRNVDYVRVFAPLAIQARNVGDTARYMKLRWMIDNLAPGGIANRDASIIGAFDGSSVSLPIFYFLACDPATPSLTDPRSAMPTEHFAPGPGVLLSRTDWSPTASWFTSKASWNSIDHQFADAGSFGLWRNGEWLTKLRLGYGAHIACSDYQNTLAIENPAVTNVTFWQYNSDRGSQYVLNGTQDPTDVRASWSPAFAFFESNLTNTYNNPKIGAGEVEHASRSTVFLKPDFVITYDRAKTTSANRYKRFWMNTAVKATVSGRNAAVTMASGQRLYFSTVLPTTGVLTASAAEALGGEPAQMEPMKFRLMVTDPANPQEVRYLNVLQGAHAGAVKIAPVLLTSSAGTDFAGVRLGTYAVMFRKNLDSVFTTTTFTVPNTITSRLVTGLTPGASYKVTVTPTSNSFKITIVPGVGVTADQGGVISF